MGQHPSLCTSVTPGLHLQHPSSTLMWLTGDSNSDPYKRCDTTPLFGLMGECLPMAHAWTCNTPWEVWRTFLLICLYYLLLMLRLILFSKEGVVDPVSIYLTCLEIRNDLKRKNISYSLPLRSISDFWRLEGHCYWSWMELGSHLKNYILFWGSFYFLSKPPIKFIGLLFSAILNFDMVYNKFICLIFQIASKDLQKWGQVVPC